jgi:hypothetical protein
MGKLEVFPIKHPQQPCPLVQFRPTRHDSTDEKRFPAIPLPFADKKAAYGPATTPRKPHASPYVSQASSDGFDR